MQFRFYFTHTIIPLTRASFAFTHDVIPTTREGFTLIQSVALNQSLMPFQIIGGIEQISTEKQITRTRN